MSFLTKVLQYRAVIKSLFGMTVSPKDYGAVGGGVVDDTTALSSAITAASNAIGSAFGHVSVDLVGLQYGISSGLTLPKGVYLRNGSLKAIGSSWAVTDPIITILNVENAGINGVEIDCQWKCAGVLRNSAYRSHIKSTRIQRFKTYGLKDTGTTQESSCTETVIRQYVYGDSGYDAIANRDAHCLWVDTADSLYTNVVALYGLTPIYVTGTLNLFVNCHAYNGATIDGSENIAVKIEGAAATNNLFTNTYIDNGVCQLIDAFKNSFVSTQFQRTAGGNNSKAFELITSSAGADGAGFSATDVRFNGTYSTGYLTYSTTGSGTWATNKKIFWMAARKSDGAVTNNISQWSDKSVIDGSGRFVSGHTASTQIGSNQSNIQAVGSGTAQSSIGLLSYGNDASGSGVYLGKSRGGAIGTYSRVLSGDVIGRISAVGDDGVGNNYNANGAKIEFRAAVNWDGTNRDTDVVFSTTDTNVITDRFLISASGHSRPCADDTYTLGSQIFRFSEFYGKILKPGDGTVKWTTGTGTPEGAVTAPVGSMYTRTDGGANTTLYIKESGTGNTGWVAK